MNRLQTTALRAATALLLFSLSAQQLLAVGGDGYDPSTETPLGSGVLKERVKDSLSNVGSKIGFSDSKSPFEVLGLLLGVVLGVVGVVFVIITIQGGFLWMTAGGKEDQVKQARDKIANGAIGIIIIFAAYMLTGFVLSQACHVINIACG